MVNEVEQQENIKTYSGRITSLKPNQVFVFGSNPQGRHGMGAAKDAIEMAGAIYGKGRGFAGQSYALVTKNLEPKNDVYYMGKKVKHVHEWVPERGELIIYDKVGERSVSLQQIIDNIEDLYKFANRYKGREFLVAYTESKNLNGYTTEEMGAAFSSHKIPSNVYFEEDFAKYLIQE